MTGNEPVATGLVGWVLLAGSVVLALYGIWRYIIRPVARAVTIVVQIGGDFLGHDARPGVARVPGVMERLGSIETQIKVNGTGLPLGEATAALLRKADQLEAGRKENAAGIEALKTGQDDAKAAAHKAADLAAEVHDELHHWVAEGQVREETYRETLREVHGIDLDPPPRRDPHARTREDDEPQEP